ncbi:MAG TPA: lysophospholipid acyltransferase family protein [Tepidisphaeraceae bacterium]|jgi:1-acyl-sn-glycerol-3-phosphate acyltransferase|nr:lysophospholipid acyltransferase family protein [Tepidisphaeraceae bacterium]
MADEAMESQPAGKGQRYSPHWFYGGCKAICRVVTSVWFDFKVHGVEHVPRSGGVLLICNHQSYLDPVFVGVRLQRQISFIAKSQLFEAPGLSWLIRRLNTFPVRRGETDVTAIKEALRRVHEGHVLTMFPEGTRSWDGNLLPIQSGIALIVKRAEAPVIPAVLDGAQRAWPRGSKFPKAGPVRLMYGPPLELGKKKGAEIVVQIDQTFRRMLSELRELHPELKRANSP